MKNKIYIKHWLALKPQNYNGKTDLYYLKVANKINSNLNNDVSLVLSQFMSKDDKALFCCFLTCYFEDVISGTNIWESFKLMYKELYDKKLPFYIIEEDYIDAEINFEDIAFLTWYFLNTIQEDQFINPYNDFIFDISTLTMQVLNEEYEYAPENSKLKKIFQLKGDSEEFYDIRQFMQTVFFESYLFNTDIKYKLDLENLEIIEENKNESYDVISSYLREITELFTFNKTSSLLALKAKDWAKAVLGKSHSRYGVISSISEKIFGLFFYKEQNSTSVFLEHIATSMIFEMTKKSFDFHMSLKEDEIIYIGLVRYKEAWWFSGNFSTQGFDADVILDQKNSAEERSSVNFLYDQNKFKSILNGQEKAFLEFNDSYPIVFLKSGEIEAFVSKYMEFYNNAIQSDPNELEKAKQRAKNDGYFGKESIIEDNYDEVIIFFNPNNGIEIYNDVINAFPDENNPFFTEESSDDIIHLLMSPNYSTEFVNYFIKTYKSKLSFFKEEPYKSYLNDLDFLLRFWKKNNYKTKNTLVLTGNQSLTV